MDSSKELRDSEVHDSNPQQLLPRYIFLECMRYALIAILLVSIGILADILDDHNWWFRGHYEILSLIKWTVVCGVMWINGIILCRIATPGFGKPGKISKSIVAALFFAAVGLRVGAGYAHLCMAGSRVIEVGAFFGTPLLVGTIVLVSKGRIRGYTVATFVLALVWFLKEPYLAWAHGSPII